MKAVKNITDFSYFVGGRAEICDPEYNYSVKWVDRSWMPDRWTSLPTFVLDAEDSMVNSLPVLITKENHMITEYVWPLIHKYKNKPQKVHTVFKEWQDAMSIDLPPVTKQFNEEFKYVWMPIDEYSAENPWHIWIDLVSRFRLLEKIYPNHFEDYVYVLANPSAYFDKIAKVFFPKVKYMVMPKNETWRFKHIFVPSMSNHKDGIITPAMPNWLQRMADKSTLRTQEPTKKIIISRKQGNRTITNQAQLVMALKGWETVTLEDMSIEDQVKCFSSATHILSPHGAGLINLLWCHPGTKVIEIQHEAFLEKKVYPILSHHLKLDHHVYVADTENIDGPKPKNKKAKDMVNFRLNISDLIQRYQL